MKSFRRRFLHTILIAVSVMLFCSSCSAKRKKCEAEYHEGQVLFGKYVRFHDTTALRDCTYHYHNALSCPDTKMKAITAIFQMYAVMNRYNDAISFIDSFKESDFQYPFSKALWRNHCLAAIAMEKGDTAAAAKEHAAAADAIEKYIATLPEKEVNSELISGLFMEKGYVLSKEEYDAEIMRYMQKYPAQKEALNMLRNNYEVIHNNGKPASVTAYPLPR